MCWRAKSTPPCILLVQDACHNIEDEGHVSRGVVCTLGSAACGSVCWKELFLKSRNGGDNEPRRCDVPLLCNKNKPHVGYVLDRGVRVLNLQGRMMGTRINARAVASCLCASLKIRIAGQFIIKIEQITHQFWFRTPTRTGCLHASTEPIPEARTRNIEKFYSPGVLLATMVGGNMLARRRWGREREKKQECHTTLFCVSQNRVLLLFSLSRVQGF